jgi:hypothetical protein
VRLLRIIEFTAAGPCSAAHWIVDRHGRDLEHFSFQPAPVVTALSQLGGHAEKSGGMA